MNRARDRWTDRFGPEQDDPAHVLVWGRRRALDDLVGPADGPPDAPAPSRFAGLATRLWTPVRDAEELR
jgi:exodeoxyribonuclease V gamma subunit